MHRHVITEHFDPPKTSGLWLVVEHFYSLSQILTSNSLHTIQQGHICVLEREFGPQHLNYLSVGSISIHNLVTFVTFVEPYLIILITVPLERIYPCLL